MGGTVALNFAIAHPEMCRGIIVASAGSGSDDREAFLASAQVVADRLLSEGMAAVAHDYARAKLGCSSCGKTPRDGKCSMTSWRPTRP